MKIAVVNETSAGDKNKDIVAALQNRDHEIINAGMKEKGGTPELTIVDTGFLSALLLNAGIADFVVGGCGTGQGFLNSVMQYPGVICGFIVEPIDAFLFNRINGGNCISLALNQGYGWASDINLNYIFDKLFAEEPGLGYPDYRAESQRNSRRLITAISKLTHIPFAKIVERMDPVVIRNVLSFPGVWELIEQHQFNDTALRKVLESARKR